MRAVEVRVTGDSDDARRALRGTESDLRSLDKTAKSTDGGLKGIGGTLAKIGGALLAAGALRKGVGLLKESVGLASDLAETTSKIGVVFGKNAAGVTTWAKTSNAALVSTEKSVLDVVAGFNILLGNKGVTGGQGRRMSKTLTDLSADLASFFNTDVSQAASALTSALKGEMDPLEAYGVSLDDATLKARALAMGLYSGKGPLDQQAKAMAAYQEILAQTVKAQGDLERTQGSTSNQMRQFTTNIDELKTTAGLAFTPLLDKYLPGINKWLTDLNNQDGAERLGKQLLSIGDRAEEVWPRIQGFFEDIKDAFAGVSKDEITGTFDALAGSAETMAGWVGSAFKAFNDLSPQAKENILLLVAAGAALGVAKKNPIVKIGVDLVAGTIQSMAETMATAIATRMFSGAFAQRVIVINWPPGAYTGGVGGVGGGTSKLGKLFGAAGTILGVVGAVSLLKDGFDASVKKQKEYQDETYDYMADLKAADARITGFVDDALTSQSLGLRQGLEQQRQYLDFQTRRVAEAGASNLAASRKAEAKEREEIRKASIARDKELAKAISANWEKVNKLYAEGKGYGQNNPAITGRWDTTTRRSPQVTVNNYYPEPERASDNLAMSLRVARYMGGTP